MTRFRLSRRVVVVATILAGAAAAARAEGIARPVNVVLEDQFRNRHETARLRGDVVVLVYAGRHGAEAALDLGRRLHLRFHPSADKAEADQWSRQPVVPPAGWPAGMPAPDVHVVPIACVPEVPSPLHPLARARLRQESPHVSVWLDFDDVMRQTFGMATGVPNVAIVDTAGCVHRVISGKLDQLAFEELVGSIERVQLAARPAVRTAAVPEPPGAVVPASAVQ